MRTEFAALRQRPVMDHIPDVRFGDVKVGKRPGTDIGPILIAARKKSHYRFNREFSLPTGISSFF